MKVQKISDSARENFSFNFLIGAATICFQRMKAKIVKFNKFGTAVQSCKVIFMFISKLKLLKPSQLWGFILNLSNPTLILSSPRKSKATPYTYLCTMGGFHKPIYALSQALMLYTKILRQHFFHKSWAQSVKWL